MTLEQWASKQPYRVQYKKENEEWSALPERATLATIPDSVRLKDRARAWDLEDWRLSSSSAGSLWFVRR